MSKKNEIDEVAKKIKEVISELITSIKNADENKRIAGETRLLFPNGIDLIEASVNLGSLTNGPEVKVKLAAKGA